MKKYDLIRSGDSIIRVLYMYKKHLKGKGVISQIIRNEGHMITVGMLA